MNINRHSKTPLYMQIYNDINQRLHQGEYSFGSMLPPESKLCSIYGVDRATVRRALAMIVDDGKIVRIPGLGTSVLNPVRNCEKTYKRTMLFLLPRDQNEDRISQPFNAKLMSALEQECILKGFVLLYRSYDTNDTADDITQSCNPSGVFFISYLPIDLYKMLHMKGIPAILVNAIHPVAPSICLDNMGGARMMTEHLISMGHQQIGFIGVDSDCQIMANRFTGYKNTLERNGLKVNSDWIVYGDWTMNSGRVAMRQLIEKGSLPTAIFAANDAMAIGAIMEALDSGFSVPGDVSIVGFDNIDQSSCIRPALTTVAVDYQAMSRAACMLMIDMLDRKCSKLNVNIYIPLNVVYRDSTRSMNEGKARLIV